MTSASKLFANPAVGPHRRSHALIGLLLALLVMPQVQTSAQHTAARDRDTVMKGFTERVNAYVDLKKKLDAGLPTLKPGAVSTGAAQTHEQILAQRIREARADAKPGTIFGDAAVFFKDTVERDMKARGGADTRALLKDAPPKQAPAVNADYPQPAALGTVPPLLLVNLPRLPDGLEYRFMGRDLIIRDRTANIIVDFVSDVLPPVRRSGG